MRFENWFEQPQSPIGAFVGRVCGKSVLYLHKSRLAIVARQLGALPRFTDDGLQAFSLTPSRATPYVLTYRDDGHAIVEGYLDRISQR